MKKHLIITICMERDLKDRMDHAVAMSGKSRSAFLREAIEAYLDRGDTDECRGILVANGTPPPTYQDISFSEAFPETPGEPLVEVVEDSPLESSESLLDEPGGFWDKFKRLLASL